ncbi:MAG: hypothetical protein RJB66_1175 [Pseudomonadota bacterium]|jgi:hypothetical protein
MNFLKNIFAVILSAMIFSAAKAATVEVYGKKYFNNCSYFSSINSEMVFIYNNPEIETPGVRVFVHYGMNGHFANSGEKLEWQNINDQEMTALGNSLWNLKLELILHNRAERVYYDGVSFVFMIVYPDGSVTFDNSGYGTMSYYKVTWPEAGIGCNSPSESSAIPMIPMEVRKVEKDL